MPEGLFLRTTHGRSSDLNLLRLELIDPVGPVEAVAKPGVLTLTDAGGNRVEICFATPDQWRFRCHGHGLRLVRDDWRPFDHVVPRPDGSWVINSYQNRLYLGCRALAGAITVDAPWERVRCPRLAMELRPSKGAVVGEFLVAVFEQVWPPPPACDSFDAAVARQQAAWHQWRGGRPEVCDPVPQAAEDLAAYVQWSCLAGPAGHFHRPAMVMSKYKMRNVWTWDQCFNALALWPMRDRLALDQMHLAFDHQSLEGALPCSFNDDARHWHAVKPPAHGWALSRMHARQELPLDFIADLYPKLLAWTRWWFQFRDHDGDGLPEAEHGNDTGWDNASVFDGGPVVRSPDLAAFLVLQWASCADFATALGKPGEAADWQRHADALQERLLASLWDERAGQFVSRLPDGAKAPGDSLLNFMPLVLGERLARPMVDRMVAGLLRPGRFLTPHGLATEALDSPFYDPKGYWRGPIWAPPTLLIIDGLRRAGRTAEARDLAERFQGLAERSGFPENYEATTGAPLRDPTYTWTASVYQVLRDAYGAPAVG